MNKLQNHRKEKTANPKQATRNLVFASGVFAVAILIVSVAIVDEDTSQTVTLMLIALWFVPFLYFAQARNQSSN